MNAANAPSNLIRFACPHCGKPLRAPPEMAGKVLPCPNQACGKPIKVALQPHIPDTPPNSRPGGTPKQMELIAGGALTQPTDRPRPATTNDPPKTYADPPAGSRARPFAMVPWIVAGSATVLFVAALVVALMTRSQSQTVRENLSKAEQTVASLRAENQETQSKLSEATTNYEFVSNELRGGPTTIAGCEHVERRAQIASFRGGRVCA